MALYAFICTVAAALLTSFYSWRLIFKTFHGEPHDRKHWKEAHESPMTMLIPLGFLALGSVVSGFAFKGIFAGHGVESFFRESLTFAKANTVLEDMHHIPLQIGLMPTVMMVVGFVIAWHFYIRRPDIPVELARQHDYLYRFLLNKWYFDELYDFIFIRPAKWVGRELWKKGDGWLIDGFGPDGVSARVLDITRNVVLLQTGYLYHYAFAMLIGAAAFITWFMFSAGIH
jgi:NADH-quinone oxidoreductase subunit L